ncbi:MAG: hypothetical protein C0516_08885 [Gemmatimonas sp.]|nr:hypothetical protein [Gemmatimonas sp.]
MSPTSGEPPALHQRALQDLSYIRRTMEGAAAFTDVPGWGLVVVGGVALVAAWLASSPATPMAWLLTWLGAAVVAVTAGGLAMQRKMRRRLVDGGSLQLTTPLRKFLLGFWPAVAVGAVLTLALLEPSRPGLVDRAAHPLLPGVWLLLYGLGVTTAGAYSIRAVPVMGLAFMALGAVALWWPSLDGNLMMALGFGGLQIGFGAHIARRHGG